jgi:hypothetical protein
MRDLASIINANYPPKTGKPKHCMESRQDLGGGFILTMASR